MTYQESKILAAKLEKAMAGMSELSSALTDIRMNWLNRRDGSAAEVTIMIPRGEYCGDCRIVLVEAGMYKCFYFEKSLHHKPNDDKLIKCQRCQDYCNMGRYAPESEIEQG